MKISLPEQIWIDYEPANFGSRALAYIVDVCIRWSALALILLFLSLIFINTFSFWQIFSNLFTLGGLGTAVIFIGIFIVEWGYNIFFDVYRDGVTPGKKLMNLRVVSELGLPITFKSSFLRNAFIVIDLLPGLGFVGLVSMVLTKRSQRLGDLAAKTNVVYEGVECEELDVGFSADKKYSLPLEIYGVLQSYFNRRKQLDKSYREKAIEKLYYTVTTKVNSLPEILPNLTIEQKEFWLEDLFKASSPIKKSNSKVKGEVVIDWKKFNDELKEIEESFKRLANTKVDLSPHELNIISQNYQKLSHRFSYLSSFYPNTSEVLKVAKLLRMGRRLIYSTRLERITTVKKSFFSRVFLGASFIKWHILLSTVLFFLPAFFAFFLVKLDSNLIWFIFDEDTVNSLKSGSIWTDSIKGYSSMAASQIMTNNIRVSIMALISGITGGVCTVFVLVTNGIHLGAVFSSLAYFQMSGRLLDFIVAHGFLEISVIVVSGACGLYIGQGLINPKNLPRKLALQKHIADVFEIIILNTVSLVFAGLVEGFVSPYEINFSIKILLGITLGLFYWIIISYGFLVKLKTFLKISPSKLGNQSKFKKSKVF